MHHPENHLTWNERIDPKSLFSNLKKKSDIVLSSHEHVPKEYVQSHDINQTLHLKSGSFIELEFIKNKSKRNKINQLDYYNESNLNKSTFSILDINITKKKVQEDKYAYNSKSKRWKKLDVLNSIFPLFNDQIMLNHADMQHVYSKIKLINYVTLIKKVVNKELDEVKGYSNICSFDKELYIMNHFHPKVW